MSDRDDTRGIALAVLALAAGLVVAGVLALAVTQGQLRAEAKPAANVAAEHLGRVERIDFAPGSSALPPHASEALESVAEVTQRIGKRSGAAREANLQQAPTLLARVYPNGIADTKRFQGAGGALGKVRDRD
jgi:ABC-type transporter Mla subunit MlaD